MRRAEVHMSVNGRGYTDFEVRSVFCVKRFLELISNFYYKRMIIYKDIFTGEFSITWKTS